MRPVKLALVQFQSVAYDVPANVEKGLKFVEDAARQGADLIVFPELFLTGYDPDAIGERPEELAQNIDGFAVQAFATAAAANHINLVVPFPLKDDKGIYNSAAVIDRSGTVVGVYHKVHLWEGERAVFQPGDRYLAAELDFGKVGVLICYDAGFPEAARTLALRGVELIVVPAAFSGEMKYRWDIYFPARALENSCFLAAVNAAGPIGKEYMFGNNKLVNPYGKVVMDGTLNAEEMQVVEIDLDESARYPYPYLKDLRTDTYVYKG